VSGLTSSAGRERRRATEQRRREDTGLRPRAARAERGQSNTAPLLPGTGPLAKVPPAAVFVAILIVFAAAIVIRGPLGAALLGVLALGVAGMLAATWPVISTPARAGRVAVLGALVAVALTMALAN